MEMSNSDWRRGQVSNLDLKRAPDLERRDDIARTEKITTKIVEPETTTMSTTITTTTSPSTTTEGEARCGKGTGNVQLALLKYEL